jgi:hypothetical protein
MTITVDIKPEVQAELARQAASSGKPVEEYAASLLEGALCPPTAYAAPRAKNLVELFAPIRGLFADGELDFSRNPSTGRPVDLS